MLLIISQVEVLEGERLKAGASTEQRCESLQVCLAKLLALPPGALLVDTQKLQATKKVRIVTDRLQDFVPVGGLLAEDGDFDLRELDARLDDFDNKVGEDSPCLLDAVLCPLKDKTLQLLALLGEELERFSCDTLQCLGSH